MTIHSVNIYQVPVKNKVQSWTRDKPVKNSVGFYTKGANILMEREAIKKSIYNITAGSGKCYSTPALLFSLLVFFWIASSMTLPQGFAYAIPSAWKTHFQNFLKSHFPLLLQIPY